MGHFRETVTRRRYDGDAWQDGHYDKGPASEAEISVYLEPATGEEAESLPEGKRSRVEFFGATSDDIRGVDLEADEQADEILYNGQIFEVHQVKSPGTASPFNRTEFWLLRQPEGTE